uniref:Uncharacterized protein n=1 Tax=Cacopsylla melanoneura TaxID=428564 RepID=A0A8D8SSE2_9HEMI
MQEMKHKTFGNFVAILLGYRGPKMDVTPRRGFLKRPQKHFFISFLLDILCPLKKIGRYLLTRILDFRRVLIIFFLSSLKKNTLYFNNKKRQNLVKGKFYQKMYSNIFYFYYNFKHFILS